jgi:hypothetical protein
VKVPNTVISAGIANSIVQQKNAINTAMIVTALLKWTSPLKEHTRIKHSKN